MAHDTSMRGLTKLIHTYRTPLETLIEISISRCALIENYEAFVNAYNIPVAPVLKSNAYGHGLLPVARILAKESPPLLVVDSYYEADLLRRDGIRTPILIIGFVPVNVIKKSKLTNVAFVVTSVEGLAALMQTGSKANVHIKLDTGMHRQGVLPQHIGEAIAMLKKSSLVVEGVCSHLASADSDPTFTHKQIDLWNKSVSVWRQAFPLIHYWHIAASAGSVYAHECDTNLIRLGAGLYGYERIPSRSLPLLPVLSMHTQITIIKEIGAGETVGYNGTFVAPGPMRIATVPVGYFEGYDRRLSNKGVMLVGGVACPVIGRVSMNMTILDVTQCAAEFGSEVVVISDNPVDPNSLGNLSYLCDMSPLEFVVHIPQHLRRVVV